MEVRGKRRGIDQHRPGLPIIYRFGLKDAPRLIATTRALIIPQVGKSTVDTLGIRPSLVASTLWLVP